MGIGEWQRPKAPVLLLGVGPASGKGSWTDTRCTVVIDWQRKGVGESLWALLLQREGIERGTTSPLKQASPLGP